MELKLHLAETGTSINIGERCLIASNVEIRSGDSHSIYDSETGERLNFGKSVSIGKNVWIAKDVKVLKGSIIPAGSVVSTGSIVTKKFEHENALYAGVPAVLKRKNIRWEYPIGK
jgi:acetyltransferase-like isoleucine patch superfamily enzyme